MRLPGDDDQRPAGFSLIYMIIGVSAFVLIMLVAVMNANKKQNNNSNYAQKLQQQKQEEQAALENNADAQIEEPKPKLRAEDLDFWDMYPVDEEKSTPDTSQANKSESKGTTTKTEEDNKKEEKIQEILKEDPSTDGKHTLVRSADGTEEWVLISPYLKKNTYDFTNLSESAGIRKYTENGKKVSKIGVNISKHSGAVNFRSMKSAGIDYVMLRLGARGYGTGQISLDDNFVENIEAAIEAGLDIGIYFYSQAISQEEATQEANFVIQNLEPYKAHINYPVAFDMENVPNDNARIDGLARDDKTTITATFLSGVQAAGYIPMLYGNKEWLIKNIDLTKVQDYDVWLAEDDAIPDYPYLYTMWQYTTTGVVNGVTGDASINICFVSYSDR
ncbi:MAG: hypothetical protein HDR03_04005 [Lachnospiraceae bacterium]|nr:hypothetical protein [Lachnospiraceae bacterium]